MSNNSILHQMAQYDFIKNELLRLQSELEARKNLIDSLPETCGHPIIIHYGVNGLHVKRKEIISDFLHCPLCGQQNFKLLPNPNGQIFLIDKLFPFGEPLQKLLAIKRILKMGLEAYGNKEILYLKEKLEQYYHLKWYTVECIKAM